MEDRGGDRQVRQTSQRLTAAGERVLVTYVCSVSGHAQKDRDVCVDVPGSACYKHVATGQTFPNHYVWVD